MMRKINAPKTSASTNDVALEMPIANIPNQR
jgi:hypothetical protein